VKVHVRPPQSGDVAAPHPRDDKIPGVGQPVIGDNGKKLSTSASV
jgi:hypothetical protein